MKNSFDGIFETDCEQYAIAIRQLANQFQEIVHKCPKIYTAHNL